ncbi:MAG: transposase [Betaproteobacteria bacterium]|nr:MAG: transposase [Betaproteobacteria bacterium]
MRRRVNAAAARGVVRCAMPRLACPEEAHGTLHVVQRARERRVCFSCTGDRAAYLEALRECAARAECAVHAYALMGNHVHLLLTPVRAEGAARLMPALAAGYAYYLATAYGHEDSVWEEPYDASPVHARAHLLACMRYIEENPVRAGLAAHPGAYRCAPRGLRSPLRADRRKDHSSFTPAVR